jgi:hypothetical protein
MSSVVPHRLALQAAMFFAESELLPYLRAAALDYILAIRILVDHELDDPLMCDAATLSFDETTDCRLYLKELLARAILIRQVEQQMTMHDV